jgi:hypothetical protein
MEDEIRHKARFEGDEGSPIPPVRHKKIPMDHPSESQSSSKELVKDPEKPAGRDPSKRRKSSQKTHQDKDKCPEESINPIKRKRIRFNTKWDIKRLVAATLNELRLKKITCDEARTIFMGAKTLSVMFDETKHERDIELIKQKLGIKEEGLRDEN